MGGVCLFQGTGTACPCLIHPCFCFEREQENHQFREPPILRHLDCLVIPFTRGTCAIFQQMLANPFSNDGQTAQFPFIKIGWNLPSFTQLYPSEVRFVPSLDLIRGTGEHLSEKRQSRSKGRSRLAACDGSLGPPVPFYPFLGLDVNNLEDRFSGKQKV